MLEKKKRITKKEMKQDTLVTSYYNAQKFFFENQVKILIGVGVLAIVVVAVILLGNKRANDNILASGLVSKVIPIYDQNQFQEAIDGDAKNQITGLKSIVDKYGSTEQGETAKIMLANCYFNTGNFEAAFENYKDYGGSNPILKATSLAGQAAYYETKKEYAKAVDLYKEASKISEIDPSNSEYLLKAGVNLLQLGKKEEAKKIFETIKKDFASTYAGQEVDRYLVQAENSNF